MPRGPRPESLRKFDEVRKLRAEGHGIRRISKLLKISHVTIWKWLKHLPKPDRMLYTPIPIQKMLVQNSPHGRRYVKERLMRDGLLENACAICKQPPIWNGHPLTLRLDHINGENTDYRIENLRLLCPNCDSQTDTYCGRNRKRKRMERHAGVEPASTGLEPVALPLS